MFRPRTGRRPQQQPPFRQMLEVLGEAAGLTAIGGGGGSNGLRRSAAQGLPISGLGQRFRLSQRAGACARSTSTGSQRYLVQVPAAAPTAVSWGRRSMATTTKSDGDHYSQAQPIRSGSRSALPDLDRVVALVSGARTRLLSHPGTPSEEETATALRICGEAADLIMDASVQPQLNSIDHRSDTAASTLLSLDAGRKANKEGEVSGGGGGGVTAASAAAAPSPASGTETPSPPAAQELSPRLRDVVGQISDAAYAVIEDGRVRITPRLLEQYVAIQARLGRPESLPRVLELYGSARRGAARAVQEEVAEAALDAALAARDLDAAVGVVENTYAAPATVRAKLLRKGFLPGFAAVGVPLATYMLASQLAAVQTTLDDRSATAMAFAAILAYIGCTGAIGAVATATANDQMRRVTWSPGTPLRERWLREDERAALDRVTCTFGFTEAYRYGEEEGAEFQALREYVMRKGMLIDQTEMLEGMSS